MVNSSREVGTFESNLNFAAQAVRHSTSEALGVFMKLLGQPTMAKLMPDLGSSKFAEIRILSATARIQKTAASAAPASSAAPKAKVVFEPQQMNKSSNRFVIPKPPTDDKKSEKAAESKSAALASAKPPTTARAGSAPARKLGAPLAVAVRSRPGKNLDVFCRCVNVSFKFI